MVFGGDQRAFWRDQPEAVALPIGNRLQLRIREWFVDTEAGTDYSLILGRGTEATRDVEIQDRITGTQGVKELVAYASSLGPDTRTFTVSATVETIYGAAVVQETLG